MNTANSLLDALMRSRPSDTRVVATQTKALAWARVSTDMQEEKGLSIPEQLRGMSPTRLTKHGNSCYVLGGRECISTGSKRIEFHRMIAHAKAHPEVSVILVHDFSRFSRDSAQAKMLIRDLRIAASRYLCH